CGRDGDSLVALAHSVDIVVVGDVRATGQFEDHIGARGDPVALVGVGPGEGALGVHLLGDLLEPVPVLGGVPVEVVGEGLLAVPVGDRIVDGHGFNSSGYRGYGATCLAVGGW